MEKMGTTEDIANMVLFLSDEGKSAYITGSNFCVDGGHTASPLL